MKIVDIDPHGFAAEIGLQTDDDLLSINGNPIRDPLDFEFWRHEQPIEILIRRDQSEFIIEIEDGLDSPLGIEFEEMATRCCGNKCIFCFVDQNPANMRSALYIKDEDYRLSFLYGNYVTLTNASQRDLHRIVDQRLSPLYISVHATDLDVRKRMLGLRRDDHLIEKIDFLARGNITLHAQIVLCPGINNGEILEKTVTDLIDYYPKLKTLAIVPVGLTRHRAGLPDMQPVTPSEARELFVWYNRNLGRWKKMLKTSFVFLADEFYLMLDEPLPPHSHYEEYEQIENGVGMSRDFIETFSEQSESFPRRMKPQRLRIVTGRMAAPLLKQIVVPRLRQIKGLDVDLVAIENRFYGERITVSGLLTGKDIASQLVDQPKTDLVLLPPNCINHDGKLLDDWTPVRLQEALQTPVLVANDGFLPLHKSEKAQ
ncbi:DUF512 domain-containing protein [candidate division KSB1 bacterium]|nr:DUF512 domain-containing protein [candidate division KSB1 bacterium]